MSWLTLVKAGNTAMSLPAQVWDVPMGVWKAFSTHCLSRVLLTRIICDAQLPFTALYRMGSEV